MWMKYVALMLPLVASVAVHGQTTVDVPVPDAPLQKVSCEWPGLDAAKQRRLSCFTLRVKTASGKVLQLAGLRRLSDSTEQTIISQSTATPVLFVGAGPGAALRQEVAAMPSDLVPGHETIVLDWRGSGDSLPKFCPNANVSNAQCVQNLVTQGYELEDFGSAAMVQDLEFLRKQLEIDRWHLYAAGDATPMALHYLATAPRSLSAVLLDAVKPPPALRRSEAQQQADFLRELSTWCRQQDSCQSTFADVNALYQQAAQSLAQAPLSVGASSINAASLPTMLHHAMQSPEHLSLLPWVLKAVRDRRADLIAPWLAHSNQLQQSNDAALLAHCADRPTNAVHLEDAQESLCATFIDIDDEQVKSRQLQLPERAQVRMPVLLLSGSLTPEQTDLAVLQEWLGPLTQTAFVPGALQPVRSHSACTMAVLQDFLQQPRQFGLPTCLKELQAPYFVPDVAVMPVFSQQVALLQHGQPSVPLFILATLFVFAMLLGPLWSLTAVSLAWLLGDDVPLRPVPLLVNLLQMLLLSAFGMIAWQAWQAIGRQSGELLYGLPAQTELWRALIAIGSCAGLYALHQCCLSSRWRLAFSTILCLSMALCAIYLQWLP